MASEFQSNGACAIAELNQPVEPQKPVRNLKANPFTTYRDPRTGRWIVEMSNVMPSFN
ncbi:MAG TPA: hypothetical protein V6C88_04295 [Chroococcidiopsis sp.]